jgi:hypothetical protein
LVKKRNHRILDNNFCEKRFDVVIIADDDDVEKGKANPSVFICGSTAEGRSGTVRRPPVVIQNAWCEFKRQTMLSSNS